ncbi:MAG: amidohydrolase [Isosphaeraceae bacterium]|nr:amidohydrolase [Isosphaeraceae bacterium]
MRGIAWGGSRIRIGGAFTRSDRGIPFLGPLVCVAALGFLTHPVGAQTSSLQELAGQIAAESLPKVTIFTAKEILTLDPARPSVQAVAIVGDRILAAGSLQELKSAAGDQQYKIDETFADKVIVPGFIAQHDHPVLTALTMASEILSIEDWVLPSGTVPAVKDKADFMRRLAEAEKKLGSPAEPLVTWGYHEAFFGKLSRAELDTISKTRPILVWGRSCHEVFLNDAALKAGGVTKELVEGWSKSQKEQSDFEKGHFWEQGVFAVGAKVGRMIATPERLNRGLLLTRDYMHSKGITFGNEPGGILIKPLQDAVNAVFSQPTMPFRWTYMVDGKTLCDRFEDDDQVLAESEKLESWYTGMTSRSDKSVKLFADGAIFSQLMQVRVPYLDGHSGEWMTDLDVFRRAFRVYWDAGYQIHIHVNGDAGLDRVLDTLEANIRRHPRYDHRTNIVHFAVSARDQVERMKRLGCIVSGNPYYVTALADNYGKVGLGPERADQMVRMGDVEKAGISFSYHSDMPMAPADPLFLMWCGVNRITTSGRVAGEGQRVSREAALRAVTLDAAYSLGMDKEIGSIASGKLANLTILGDNPVTCAPAKIKDIAVWGTVMEGRVLPAAGRDGQTARLQSDSRRPAAAALQPMNGGVGLQLHAPSTMESNGPAESFASGRPQPSDPGCSCGRHIVEAIAAGFHAAPRPDR